MNADILLISSVYWDDPVGTPQQIAKQCAPNRKVLFVEPSPSYVHLRDRQRNRRWLNVGRAPRQVSRNLFVYSPPPVFPLKTRSVILNAISQAMIRPFIKRALAKVGIDRPVLLTFIPHFYRNVAAFDERLVGYYCVDDMSALSSIISPAIVSYYERQLISKSDLVLTTSQLLAQCFKEQHDNVYLVRNGADIDHYARALASDTTIPEGTNQLPHPVLGFSGSIDFRLDQDLISEAAARRPAWTFIFVGPVRVAVTSLLRHKNIVLVGMKPVDELPSYFKVFDVALIPYKLNKMARCIYPAKLNEYLAAGLPVVTTPLPELADCADDVITRAPDVDAFLQAAGRLAPTRWDPARIARRVDFARDHSWERQASRVLGLIDERVEAALLHSGRASGRKRIAGSQEEE